MVKVVFDGELHAAVLIAKSNKYIIFEGLSHIYS